MSERANNKDYPTTTWSSSNTTERRHFVICTASCPDQTPLFPLPVRCAAPTAAATNLPIEYKSKEMRITAGGKGLPTPLRDSGEELEVQETRTMYRVEQKCGPFLCRGSRNLLGKNVGHWGFNPRNVLD